MKNINEIKELQIEFPEDMEGLVRILANNGYEVGVSPVYETKEDLKDRYPNYKPISIIPRIKHYAVKICGKLNKPVYGMEE